MSKCDMFVSVETVPLETDTELQEMLVLKYRKTLYPANHSSVREESGKTFTVSTVYAYIHKTIH